MLELTIRMIVSLTIVVGLLLLIARLSSRRFGAPRGSMVQVMHRQALSRTSSVSVVSIGSRVLVLGATDQQVSVLTELDADEVSDPAGATEPAGPMSVAARGRRAAGRGGRHRAATGRRRATRQVPATPDLVNPAVETGILDQPSAPEMPAIASVEGAPGLRDVTDVPATARTSGPSTAAENHHGTVIDLNRSRREPLSDDLTLAEIALLLRETTEHAATTGIEHTAATRDPSAARADQSVDPFLDGLTPAEVAMLLGGGDAVDPAPDLRTRPATAISFTDRHARSSHQPAAPDGSGERRTDERTSSGHGRPTAPAPEGPLSGSILSPATWRQAVSSFTRRAS